jgi:phosphoglycerol transferase MdoB-like AlkP superfamily enzyme
MRKGIYLFPRCGSLTKKLTVAVALCFGISVILLVVNWILLLGGDRGLSDAQLALIIPLTLVGFILLVADICVHRVCEDVASLLKGVEEKQR